MRGKDDFHVVPNLPGGKRTTQSETRTAECLGLPLIDFEWHYALRIDQGPGWNADGTRPYQSVERTLASLRLPAALTKR